MIKLISGVCRVGTKLMRPADKPFSLTEKEESYLVKQGVAQFVTGETPVEEVATACGEETDIAPCGNMEDDNAAPDGADGDAELQTGYLDPEHLSKMTVSELKDLAQQLGIIASGKKSDLIVAISSAEQPVVGAEDPVV